MPSKPRNISLILFATLLLSACQTSNLLMDWPAELPNRQLFIDGYYDKRGISQASPKVLNRHLGWIVKFYQGTLIYPLGWDEVSKRFLATVNDDTSRALLANRARLLGIKIANEWAQANNIRLINNRALLAWGNGLQTSAERMDQLRYIAEVERDVELLLNGEITNDEIKFERYFPLEAGEDDNFDDF